MRLEGAGLRAWAERDLAGVTDDALRDARAHAAEALWTTKDWFALGADDPIDRLDALDRMGVRRQLLYRPVPLPCLNDSRPAAVVARRR